MDGPDFNPGEQPHGGYNVLSEMLQITLALHTQGQHPTAFRIGPRQVRSLAWLSRIGNDVRWSGGGPESLPPHHMFEVTDAEDLLAVISTLPLRADRSMPGTRETPQ